MPLLPRAALLSLACLSACVTAGPPAMPGQTDQGVALINGAGMSLYSFERDKEGQSMCNGTCLQKWPALTAPSDASPVGNWTLVRRHEGTLQWAYKGQPLYTWYQDVKPGDTKGDNDADVWHLARP